MSEVFCYNCSRYMKKNSMGVVVQDGYQVKRGDLYVCVCGNRIVTEFGEPYDYTHGSFSRDAGATVTVFTRKEAA